MSAGLRTALAAALLLAACGGSGEKAARGAQPPATAAAAAAPTSSSTPTCAPPERTIYSCASKARLVSVCATDSAITYRAGAGGHTDLQIVSHAGDGVAHLGTIRGPGSGGRQIGLRFSNAGYDYLVFSSTNGSGTDAPGERRSGVVVMKESQTIASLPCAATARPEYFDLDVVPPFLAAEDRPEFLAWF